MYMRNQNYYLPRGVLESNPVVITYIRRPKLGWKDTFKRYKALRSRSIWKDLEVNKYG